MTGRRFPIPIFYGWVLVAIGFPTMAVGVNARRTGSLRARGALARCSGPAEPRALVCGDPVVLITPSEIGADRSACAQIGASRGAQRRDTTASRGGRARISAGRGARAEQTNAGRSSRARINAGRGARAEQTSAARAEKTNRDRALKKVGIGPKFGPDTTSACNENALVIWCYPIMEMEQ